MPRAPSRGAGNPNLLLATATALLGFVGGWSFGHVHGLHACGSSAALNNAGSLRPPCSAQPRTHLIHQEANRTRYALEAATARLEAIEKQRACPKCQSASEAVSQIEELESQVRDLTASRSSSTSGGEASLDMTQWASVRAFKRETLWKETLASLPYVLGTTLSKGSLLFTRRKPANASLAAAKATCSEIDVVVASSSPDVCLAVFDSRLPIYTMLRTDASGGAVLEKQRLDQAPRLHKHAGAQAYTPQRLAKRSLIIAQQDTLPKKHSMLEALQTTAKFGATAASVVKRIAEIIKLRKLDQNHKTVIVMATNQGTLDLVANFACSCRQGPEEVQRALLSTLVFTGDEPTSKAVELFGLASFHDPALGDLPEGAAKTYGDFAFVRMMWLKITSVYSVIATGRHALFQDADVVWFRDPIAYFATQADDQVDCFFMDDGARSSRYTPLYTNSGFYFIRNNMRTQFFMHRMLLAYDTVLAVRSHQHALIMLLLDHMAKHGLTVGVLDPLLFPQGQVFHRKKAIMQSFVDGSAKPFVFHMCWTAGRTDKLRYLKNMALWFLEPKCDADSWKSHRDLGNSSFNHDQANCCLAGSKAWTVPTPYTQVIDLKSK